MVIQFIRAAFMMLVAAMLVACDGPPERALGTLEWDRVNGRAIASEVITELYVNEGDEVARDAPLLKLDSRLQELKVAESSATVEDLKWRLTELRTGYREERVQAAEAEYTAAKATRVTREREFKRLNDLVKQGATSQQETDEARSRLDQAIGQEKSSFDKLRELKAGFREEQISQAEAKLQAEQQNLAYQEELLGRYTIVAERDGILESYPFKLGDKPPVGAVVTTVLAGQAPWARIYLPEQWLGEVTEGSLVNVYVDGRTTPYEGKVRHIHARPAFTPYYGLAEKNRRRLSYVTEVDLLDDDARSLPVGIPLQVSPR